MNEQDQIVAIFFNLVYEYNQDEFFDNDQKTEHLGKMKATKLILENVFGVKTQPIIEKAVEQAKADAQN